MLCRLFELGVKLQAARAFSVVTEGPQLSFCFMQGLPEVRCRKTKWTHCEVGFSPSPAWKRPFRVRTTTKMIKIENQSWRFYKFGGQLSLSGFRAWILWDSSFEYLRNSSGLGPMSRTNRCLKAMCLLINPTKTICCVLPQNAKLTHGCKTRAQLYVRFIESDRAVGPNENDINIWVLHVRGGLIGLSHRACVARGIKRIGSHKSLKHFYETPHLSGGRA